MDSPQLLMSKEIDWSTLNYGFNIPTSMQYIFHNSLLREILPGQKMIIILIIDGESYEANIININFSRDKFDGHKDLLQIRYTSKLQKKLKEIFHNSLEYLTEQKAMQLNKRNHISIPENMKEYLYINMTPLSGTFLIECKTKDDRIENFRNMVREEEFESATINPYRLIDESASYIVKERLVKIRKLDISVCNSLKKLYDYRCQITGEKIGHEYGESVIEAHHIDYFVNSQNNDMSNILIVRPDFHRVIHKNNPVFDRRSLSYRFENGIIENIKVNLHL